MQTLLSGSERRLSSEGVGCDGYLWRLRPALGIGRTTNPHTVLALRLARDASNSGLEVARVSFQTAGRYFHFTLGPSTMPAPQQSCSPLLMRWAYAGLTNVTLWLGCTVTHRAFILLIACSILGNTGCQAFRAYSGWESQPIPTPEVANPLAVPMLDRWLVMEQISDELDDYFRIFREERIRMLDGILSEGRIETHPKIGSTVLEPWRRDSLVGFERLHATLQTVRRYAKVRVVPAGDHYQVDLQVFKELEDLPQPIGSGISGEILRHDSSLDIDQGLPQLTQPNKGWIPLGRDLLLEQQILKNIQTRLQKCANGQQP